MNKIYNNLKHQNNLFNYLMDNKNFLEFFCKFYSHMYLIPLDNENTFALMPPNQMDWNFVLTKLSDNKWKVDATRLEDWGDSVTEYTSIYKWQDDEWVSQ